jgi:2,3-bisphosphoglycerate-independent phosphoglycerate mutase
MLIILDGWGINPKKEGNAIRLANLPTWEMLSSRYPICVLDASGLSVGLRKGLMGNSEVGHLNIGAGRVVWQEITRIDRAIESGEFFKIPAFKGAIQHVKTTGGALHLMGLVSEGGVHSSENHYFALIELARREALPANKLFIHAFLDGRDTPPTSGVNFVRSLQEKLNKAGIGRIATIAGRYWGMDRDKRWERVERSYDAIILGMGRKATDPIKAVQQAYDAGEKDEFIQPIVLTNDDGEPLGRVNDGDSFIFFNFRADRTREITRAITEKDFHEFPRKAVRKVYFATMTRYHEDFTHPVAFEPVVLRNLLGEILSKNGITQLRIAETEKYAHVTFFFNGGSDAQFEGEERILIPSPKVPTYDLKPQMSAHEVTERVIQEILSERFDVIILNYANPDMVGHTGVLGAAIKAVETVDSCLGKVLKVLKAQGGVALITSDHGNSEEMIDYQTNSPHTYHTTNPVPFIPFSEEFVNKTIKESGGLKDIAPTILKFLGIPIPEEMEGESIL